MAAKIKKIKKPVNKVKKKMSTPKTKIAKKKKVSKILVAKKNIFKRLDRVNRVINRFETDVEILLKKLVKQGGRSRKDLRKNFDEILKKIRAGGIFSRANETREELEREVRRLAEEVLASFKEVESLINKDKVSDILQNARNNFVNLAEVLAGNGLLLQAKKSVVNTRREILNLFSIPTQRDVEKLEKKIINLEKRLNNLSRRAA